MANEISISAALSVAKNGASFTARGDKVLDQTGNYVVNKVQAVGTSAETVDLGDISGMPVALFLQNLEAAGGANVEIHAGSGGTVVGQINPGEPALIMRPVSTPYVRSTSGTAKVLVLAVEV